MNYTKKIKFLFGCLLFLIPATLFYTSVASRKVVSVGLTKEQPEAILKQFIPTQPHQPLIVIDDRYWNHKLSPNDSLRVMVDKKHTNSFEQTNKLNILYYESKNEKDFYTVYDRNVTRLILKFRMVEVSSNILVPENGTLFEEFWKRSEMRESRKIDMKRNDTSVYLKPDFIEMYASLRDFLISNSIFPIIACGTLLGWYRENGIIPHTYDIDLFADASQISQTKFLKTFVSLNHSELHLHKILGLPNDTFELKVGTKKGPIIDIFGNFQTANGSWTGGTDGHNKYRYDNYRLEDICAGDFLNKLAWMPCNILPWIEKEYGSKWMVDHHTKQYAWYKSQNNVKHNGVWSSAEKKLMKEVYDVEVFKKQI